MSPCSAIDHDEATTYHIAEKAGPRIRPVRTEGAFLDDMFSDPMVRLLMFADRATETEIRGLYAGKAAANDAGRFVEPSSPSLDIRPGPAGSVLVGRPGIGE